MSFTSFLLNDTNQIMVFKAEWLKCTFPLRVLYSESVHYVVATRWIRKLTYCRFQVFVVAFVVDEPCALPSTTTLLFMALL